MATRTTTEEDTRTGTETVQAGSEGPKVMKFHSNQMDQLILLIPPANTKQQKTHGISLIESPEYDK